MQLEITELLQRRWVVHCSHDPYDVYIGRGQCPKTGKQGEWGNPFDVATYGRGRALRLHRDYLLERPHLLAKVRQELRGKVLGC